MADVKDETIVQAQDQSNSNVSEDTRLANIINAAVSSQLKRHLSKFETSVNELREQFKPSTATEQVKSDTSGKGEDAQARRELEQLRAELKAEKQKAKEDAVYSTLKNYLADKVRPEALETAVKVIKADGKVKFRTDGTPFIKHDSLEYDTLEEGAAEWLNSKEATIFKPVPSAQKKTAQNPIFKTPSKPNSQTGRDNSNLTPAQKTLEQFQKLGLKI